MPSVRTQGYNRDPKTIYVTNEADKHPDGTIVLSIATTSDTACYMDIAKAEELITALGCAIDKANDNLKVSEPEPEPDDVVSDIFDSILDSVDNFMDTAEKFFDKVLDNKRSKR